MDVAYMRFSTGDRTSFIIVISAMSDLTLTNGECGDRHGADSFCKICNIHHKWVGTLKLNSHGCSACQKIFDNSEWPKYMLRNHLRSKRKLICSACRADGFTKYCTDGSTCTFCKKKQGAGNFNQYARWNQSRRNSELICDDCIDKKRCDGAKCDAILNESAVSTGEWKYKQKHPDSYYNFQF